MSAHSTLALMKFHNVFLSYYAIWYFYYYCYYLKFERKLKVCAFVYAIKTVIIFFSCINICKIAIISDLIWDYLRLGINTYFSVTLFLMLFAKLKYVIRIWNILWMISSMIFFCVDKYWNILRPICIGYNKFKSFKISKWSQMKDLTFFW